MADYDLVVRGGTVVTASDTTTCDVGVRGGRIVALGEKLGKGAKEIDAGGLLVMPGGVDSHAHIQEPKQTGDVNPESFVTGSTAALCGGTTTMIGFSPQFKGGSIHDVLPAHRERASHSLIDYSLHLIITDPTDTVINEELPPLIKEGYRSLKLFMTYQPRHVNDTEILRILACARKHGALVAVHAENHSAIEWQTERLLEAGLTAPKYHAWSKPMVVEREAVQRIIALAEFVDQPIQIFHVSGAEAAEEIRRAQQRGVKVFAETCTQYFVLTAEDLDRPGFEGAKYICSPALRTREDAEALWGYVKDGTIGVVTSDHAPADFEGPDGKQAHGNNAPFNLVSNGVPGIETRLPLLFDAGVRTGRISLNEFVAIGATNAAKLFGIYPQKGTIAIGADADLAIWDPDKRVSVTNDALHHAVDYTTYEGWEVTGWPVVTVARGEVLFEDGTVKGEPGRGRFLARGPYDYIKPTGRFPVPFDPVAGKKLD